jgi:hypothetical protein
MKAQRKDIGMLSKDLRYTGLACVALIASACGDQASTEYRGEPLLEFTGSVELLEGSDGEPVVPTLAFEGPGGKWSIMEVDVEGVFPAGFTLRVFEPPPEEALFDFGTFTGADEPVVAFAYITASPLEHETGFQNVNSSSRSSDCPFDEVCRRVRIEQCELTAERAESYDGFDETYCWAEIRECDFEIDWDADQSFESCPVVETFGNPEVGMRPAAYFRGYSQAHRVYYLATDAPENSLIARLLGSPSGVASGYHIVESRPRTAVEVEEAQRCNEAAGDLGLERYVANHPELNCEYVPGDEHGASLILCEDDATSRELRPASETFRAQVELGCPAPGDTTMHIVDTATTKLELEVGPDLPDFGFGPSY